jgi:uncharacterized lipoprotein YddW (UPF0748 family)
MVSATPRFTDIQSHWARPFIEALAQRGVVRGFPDRTYRPDQAVTRAEFAALLQAAFSRPKLRPYVPFRDVPTTHWAATAIRIAYETGFLSGYPNQEFRPNEPLRRVQAFVSLSSGLSLPTQSAVPLADLYQDAAQIPNYALRAIAAVTAAGMVVNHPTLSLLRPDAPTTRAEVAAFIYQGLVFLGQAPPIESSAIVRWNRTVSVSHLREFRGVWLTSLWQRDWPTRSGLSVAQQQAELVTFLDRMRALNLNALILHVRLEGDALYASTLEPWSHWLTGTQGQAPVSAFDPLAFAIAECHQRQIELHAWFNPYRASTSRQRAPAAPHLAQRHPEVTYDWGNQRWLDPGATVVQAQTYQVILDVVNRYDIDGVHLDDYFYPYPIAGQEFPDDATYQAYRAQGGTLERADWRRDNVNRLVQRLATGIRAAKPHVKFGISPFGIYRPGQPEPIRGLDAYDRLYADALKWLQQGWVDYLAPQLYWRIDPPAQSYTTLLDWWAAQNSQQRHLYIGNNLAQLDGKTWDLTEIERQIDLTRQRRSRQVFGNIFFSLNTLIMNRQGVSDRFQTTTYPTPTLVPTMPWLKAPSPPLPQGVRGERGKLTWNRATSEVRAWTLYQLLDDRWTLITILPAAATMAILPVGTYALCSVNRVAVESAGVVATL